VSKKRWQVQKWTHITTIAPFGSAHIVWIRTQHKWRTHFWKTDKPTIQDLSAESEWSIRSARAWFLQHNI